MGRTLRSPGRGVGIFFYVVLFFKQKLPGCYLEIAFFLCSAQKYIIISGFLACGVVNSCISRYFSDILVLEIHRLSIP